MSSLNQSDRDSLASLPNVLTLGRIAIIPLVVGLLFIDDTFARWSAFVLYAAACITDWLDGKIARERGVVSSFGRFLDPIADKLLVTAIIIMLVAREDLGGLHVIAAIIILCREILVSGLREFLAELQVPLPVSKLAKWKTTVQMIALGILLIGPAGPGELASLGLLLFWLAALLTIITGWDYLSRGLRHLLGR
ncbi:MAG TPA: CDP-diacylglycerol--glycerol-3-phosphate 3-phosphatidyltransferase [Kiloniellales bacterium]|nr:CDP-diacylglycerol--glycerol-3-phosphate 3-phosphatidyltransferase [Kiloniellales bacterium]